jgi:hypothetical protein
MDVSPAPLFLLVHSPSVGPATWAPVAQSLAARGRQSRLPDLTRVAAADDPPFWPDVVDAVLAGIADVPADRPLAVVAHSNAGLFVPLLCRAVGRPVAGCVFVDAALPVPDDDHPVVDAAGLAWLTGIAGPDGRLPRWTDWYAADVVAGLLPEPAMRDRVVAEQPRLPLSYYRQRIPAPAGWRDLPAMYLVFCDAYRAQADTAARLGWPVRRLPGEHLHQVVDPEGVTKLIIAAVDDFPVLTN